MSRVHGRHPDRPRTEPPAQAHIQDDGQIEERLAPRCADTHAAARHAYSTHSGDARPRAHATKGAEAAANEKDLHHRITAITHDHDASSAKWPSRAADVLAREPHSRYATDGKQRLLPLVSPVSRVLHGRAAFSGPPHSSA